MLSKLSEIKDRAEKILQEADSMEKLNELRVKTLGRKGNHIISEPERLEPEIKLKWVRLQSIQNAAGRDD